MRALALTDVVPGTAERFLGHPTHAHDQPHLIYVVAGIAHLRIEGEPLTLRAQESVWLAPRVPHSAQLGEGSFALGPYLEQDVVPPGRVRRVGVLPSVVEVMTAILVASPHTREQVRPFRRVLSQALREQARDFFPLVHPRSPLLQELADDALSTWFTLETLARRRHISQRQAQRLFREETGMTFSQWRTRARLNSAIRAVLGGADAAQAACGAGYASGSSLLRALSRECRISPARLQRDPREALAERFAQQGGAG